MGILSPARQSRNVSSGTGNELAYVDDDYDEPEVVDFDDGSGEEEQIDEPGCSFRDHDLIKHIVSAIEQHAEASDDTFLRHPAIANYEFIIPALLRCFGWREDGRYADQWGFTVDWPGGLKGNARLYPLPPVLRYRICVWEQRGKGKRVHSFVPAHAYALMHGFAQPLRRAALRLWLRRLYHDAGLRRVTLPPLRQPSPRQVAVLRRRRDLNVHFALLAGLQLQSALSDDAYRKFACAAHWARAWSYEQLKGVSKDRLYRALRDLVAAGLVSTDGETPQRRYWITPPEGRTGLEWAQLVESLQGTGLSLRERIRELAKDGQRSNAAIARRLGIHCSTVSRALKAPDVA